MADVLRVAVESISCLENVISPSFGPNGIDAALKTDSGNIIVTNSGHIILNSLSMSHPVGRVVVEQLKKHVGLTGDSTKEMVIILAQFLKNIHEDACLRSRNREIISQLSGLSSACAFLSSHLSNLVAYLQNSCCKVAITDMKETERCVKGMIQTALDGKFAPQTVHVFVERLTELVMCNNTTHANLLKLVENIIDIFGDICIMANGINVSHSSIIKGFIIKQQPFGKCETLGDAGSSIKFVVINNDFDLSNIQFSKLTLSFDDTQLNNFIHHKFDYFTKLSKKLEEMAVNVLLCSSQIPEPAKSIFTGKFCIFQHVYDDDIKRICDYFGILPIENLDDIIMDDLAMHVAELSLIKKLTIGTEGYTQLYPEGNLQINKPCCQLILCSPSAAIGQQYYATALNMMKILKMSFYENYGQNNESNDVSLKILPGAGFAEIKIAEYLRKETSDTENEFVQLISKSLSKALMGIPKLLFKNSDRSSSNKRFIDIQNELQNLNCKDEKGDCTGFGINGRNGNIIEPIKEGIIEPMSSKILLVNHVLQLAQMILRIEQIVPSKKINVNNQLT
eukprot:Seg6996.1 transcript_id=Seg6996.1/GoldUCD/mRNA.D3Y31 product="Thermosome subunit alpha" protein_id=Seg6996.1/GoldUCD/D3Y31